MKKSLLSSWLVAILYVGFIYATLSLVPAPLRFLRSHNLLRLSLGVLYTTCFLVLIWKMHRSGEKKGWRYAALAGVFSLYPLFATLTSFPEEQIHFLEYGLVGVLFARALTNHFTLTWKTHASALVLGSTAGWIDEILQGTISNRHYDVRDIWLNVVSVTLGLLIYCLYPPKTLSPSNKT